MDTAHPGIELRLINRWLGRIGLVLVISALYNGENLLQPTRVWLTTTRAYERHKALSGIPEWRLKR